MTCSVDSGARRADGGRAEHLTDAVHEHDDIIVDGNSGVVYVNPPVDVAREYDRLEREYHAFNRELETLKNLPAEMPDGRRVSLYANIGLIADMHLAHSHGAEGVGLYRTEFPFLAYREFPDEGTSNSELYGARRPRHGGASRHDPDPGRRRG